MTFNTELWNTQTPGAAGGYEIERSLRFNSADSAYLNRTPSTAGNRKTWTWAGWVKRSRLSGSSNQVLFCAKAGAEAVFTFNTNDTLQVYDYSGSYDYRLVTTQVFRDPSAWYHLVVSLDTTIASPSSDRLKLYVNGARVTTFSTETYPAQDYESRLNNNIDHRIGGISYGDYFNGYLADVHFIDGQALDPTSFGEFDDNGIWQPIEYTGSYGTNGFHLTFSDNSGTSSTTLGKDAAGSNNWTPNNFSVASGSGNDSLVDVPVNGDQTDTGIGGEVRGNYATLNPLQKTANATLSNGNLDQSTTASGGSIFATIGITSGKWYWEADNKGAGSSGGYGIAKAAASLSLYLGGEANGWSYFYDGNKYNNGTGTSYGDSFATNDLIGVAFDADSGTLSFYKNGVSQGMAFTGLTSGPYFPVVSGAGSACNANFGQRPFAYTAPSGFKALCTTNLAEPTIADGSTAMDVALYTGNGTTQTISGLEFSPDLAWIKPRSAAINHALFDIVRGATNRLISNLTNAEDVVSAVTAFNSDGWSQGGDYNNNGDTYVGWCWDAGSSTVTNTQGSITSQVRANASAGFSIVTYTASAGATIGHGLGVAPQLIIAKSRTSGTTDWIVYSSVLGRSQYLVLNATLAAGSLSNYWGTADPTSTVFGVYSNTGASNNAGDMVAYCFAPVAGYSSFGSYTGNGSADGPFVFCNFRPRWVLIKSYDATATWSIFDAARNTFNVMNAGLYPNSASAEETIWGIDFLSNGFKLRTTNGGVNQSGLNYIYAAFAEHPFATSRAR